MNFLHRISRPSSLFIMINTLTTALLIMLITTSATSLLNANANRLPDNVIELVGYNHNTNINAVHNQLNNRFRKARQQQPQLQNNPSALQNLNKKQRADIETVKQNIAEYNKLMKIDTKKLSEQQKVMIERIVERVARLKEDIIKKISDEKANADNVSNSAEPLNNENIESSRMSSPDFYDSTVASTIPVNGNVFGGSDGFEGTTIQSVDATQNDDRGNEKFDVKFVTDETTNLPQDSTEPAFVSTIGGENGAGNTDYVDNSTQEPKEPVTMQFAAGSTGGITQQFYTTQNAEARSNQNTNAVASNSATTLSGGNRSSSSGSQSTSAGTTGTTTSKKRSSTKRPSTSHSSSKPTAKRISSTHHYHHQRPSSPSSAASASSIKSTLIVPSISTTAAAATTLINNNDHTMATSNDDYQTTITAVPLQQQTQSIYKQQQQQQQQPTKQHSVQDQDALHSANSVLINQKQQQQLHQQLLQQHQQQLKESQQNGGSPNLSDFSEKLSNEHHIVPSAGIAPLTNSDIQIQQRTPIGAAGYISSELLYNTNGTTSTLIDSLSTQSREDYYNLNKQGGGVSGGAINTAGAGIVAGGYSSSDINKDLNKKPSGTAKPTKYHYYPHNQHIYLLPECAIQQVCNAVYVRLNYTQPLCACPSRYRDPCSASLNEDDNHTTKLVGDSKKKAITLAKTCEATTEMRECRSPKDWSLLALQNTRTGKSHYLVICRCPDLFKLEGPMAHDQPTYASVPGIRVFGMMCVKPGYSVRKPSAQPPKRYQLQKPYYIPSSSNKYGIIKDNRPSSGGGAGGGGYQQQSQQIHDSYQLQHQANYQYLNRPDSSPIIGSGSNTHKDYSDIQINHFSPGAGSSGSIYGRNNERKTSSIVAEDSSDNTENQDVMENSTDNDARDTQSDEQHADHSKIDHSAMREKRSISNDIDGLIEHHRDETMPEFPWNKVWEFQSSIVWDD